MQALIRKCIQSLLVGLFIALALIAIVWPTLAHSDVPQQAHRYRLDLTRQARLVWGLDAPVAILAAQVHQESNWQPRSISPAGAHGIAQFMPATAEWIATLDPALTDANVFNPTWSFRAMARYDHWLHSRLRGDSPCHQWAMVLSAYNGGLGWVLKDKAAAAADGASRWQWWGQVEHYNAGRSEANFRENRNYPRRILWVLVPQYSAAGWGQPACF